MQNLTRRAFGRNAIESLIAVALIDGMAARGLFGKSVEPIIREWLEKLDTISHDVVDRKLKDVEYQTALEDLYRQVDLTALLESLDFDRLAAGVQYPEHGARSLPVDFAGVEGLSPKLVFGRQIFAMNKGRSVVPHGHNDMSTGFLILKGRFRGRHWDRVEDHEDHYIIRPTIDRAFEPGGFSTVSDHKDNVHWFTAEEDACFIFNVHVTGTREEKGEAAGRVYIDPLGEQLSGGLVKAPKITYGAANRMYG
jgi:hypothetical protein